MLERKNGQINPIVLIRFIIQVFLISLSAYVFATKFKKVYLLKNYLLNNVLNGGVFSVLLTIVFIILIEIYEYLKMDKNLLYFLNELKYITSSIILSFFCGMIFTLIIIILLNIANLQFLESEKLAYSLGGLLGVVGYLVLQIKKRRYFLLDLRDMYAKN